MKQNKEGYKPSIQKEGDKVDDINVGNIHLPEYWRKKMKACCEMVCDGTCERIQGTAYITINECEVRKDFVPSDNNNEAASVASHTSTQGNSIEQRNAEMREELRHCLDTILNCSYEDLSHAIRREVVQVKDIKNAFNEYFDIEETTQSF